MATKREKGEECPICGANMRRVTRRLFTQLDQVIVDRQAAGRDQGQFGYDGTLVTLIGALQDIYDHGGASVEELRMKAGRAVGRCN